MSERAGNIGAPRAGRYGGDATDVVLAERVLSTAWNVQGDPGRTSVAADVERLFAVALPLVPDTTRRASGVVALWLGPRSWLIVEEPARQRAAPRDFVACRDALNAGGAALFDVSASRVAHTIRGTGAPRVLARTCPLDFDARVFAPGQCAQSLLGRIGALFYRHAESPAFTVMVARSFAADAWGALCLAASTEGYDVEGASPFDAA
ncbi:MAG: sarcosine oxidase subunit gamma family protein [Betaproteobacteria bacterium]